jgi:hypothetical protein
MEVVVAPTVAQRIHDDFESGAITEVEKRKLVETIEFVDVCTADEYVRYVSELC